MGVSEVKYVDFKQMKKHNLEYYIQTPCIVKLSYIVSFDVSMLLNNTRKKGKIIAIMVQTQSTDTT